MVAETLQIAAASPAERRRAVAFALGYADGPAPEGIIDRAIADTAADSAVWEGLIAARRGLQVVGATWVQFMAGAVATLTEPRTNSSEPSSTSQKLVAAATDLMQARQIVTGQALLESPRSTAGAALSAAGFTHLTDLLYLTSTSRALSVARPAGPTISPQSAAAAQSSVGHRNPRSIELIEFDPSDPGRLAAIVEETYIDTRDCPAMNGVRRIEDVLAGYKATGVFASDRWLIASRDRRDVGCLLLADHPVDNQWELVYMGVVPSARGHRLGAALVEHAQFLACTARRERLVLAVDAANEPALRMYARAGFEALLRRSVFLKRFDAPPTSDKPREI